MASCLLFLGPEDRSRLTGGKSCLVRQVGCQVEALVIASFLNNIVIGEKVLTLHHLTFYDNIFLDKVKLGLVKQAVVFLEETFMSPPVERKLASLLECLVAAVEATDEWRFVSVSTFVLP